MVIAVDFIGFKVLSDLILLKEQVKLSDELEDLDGEKYCFNRDNYKLCDLLNSYCYYQQKVVCGLDARDCFNIEVEE